MASHASLSERVAAAFHGYRIDMRGTAANDGLIGLLRNTDTAIVAAVVGGFRATIEKLGTPLASPGVFILVSRKRHDRCNRVNVGVRGTLPGTYFVTVANAPLVGGRGDATTGFKNVVRPVCAISRTMGSKTMIPLLCRNHVIPRRIRTRSVSECFSHVYR